MTETNTDSLIFPIDPAPGVRDMLTEILRQGATKMLQTAVEHEVADWIERHAHCTDSAGRKQVVRNGHLPQRSILTGIGPVAVTMPRVHDRRPPQEAERFTSAILPPYLRKTMSIERLLPWLYLYGVSASDMPRALEALLGPGAKGLSANVIVRLKQQWEEDYRGWSKRSLADKQYVYMWADGVYFNIRLEDPGNAKQCILVLMGATADGKKELIALADGYRESEQSWTELLTECKHRGLTIDPKLATGDGALGFWSALSKVYPATRIQRCWVHKTANVLSKMPKHLQGKAKGMLHDIWMAKTRAQANKALDLFVESFGVKYPGAVECLQKDRQVLLTFYDFPAEHWPHLRTSNPIESVFATVRLRTDKTKGAGSRIACLTMVWRLMEVARESWRALNGSTHLKNLIAGTIYIDGDRQDKLAA